MVRGRQWTGFDAVALQEAMRKSVREFAALLGVETTTVSNWRSSLGSVTPRPRTQEILDTTLEQRASLDDRVRFEQIVTEGEAEWKRRHTPISSPEITVVNRNRSIDPVRENDGFESPVDILERMRHLHSSDIDDATIDVIDLAVCDILDRYELEGPHRLVPEVRSLRIRVESFLAQRHHPDHLRRLQLVAGKLSGMLAYMAVNRGQFTHAKAYCREASDIAEYLEDRDLKAWVYGTRSFCAYYMGEFREAAQLAEQGIEIAGRGGQAIRLYSNGLARALGKLGDDVGVDRAIEAAGLISGEHDIPAGLTPALTFDMYSEPRLKANAATAFLAAGNYAKALIFGRQVEAQVDASDSVWSRSLVRLDMASALVRQRNNDVEQAMLLGREALVASSDRPIRSVWQRAHELKTDVTSIATEAVSDYMSELAEWSTTAKQLTDPENR